MPSAASALEASAYRFGRFSLEPGEHRLLPTASRSRWARAHSTCSSRWSRARAARHQERAPDARVARPRRRGEQPAGADLGAAQAAGAERAGDDSRDAAIASSCPSSPSQAARRPDRQAGRRCFARDARQPLRQSRRRNESPPTFPRGCRCSSAGPATSRRSRRSLARARRGHRRRRGRHRQDARRAGGGGTARRRTRRGLSRRRLVGGPGAAFPKERGAERGGARAGHAA